MLGCRLLPRPLALALPAPPKMLAGAAMPGVAAVQVRAKHGGKPTGGSRPNRVDRGLYGGKGKQSGNHVSFSINRCALPPPTHAAPTPRRSNRAA